MKVLDEMKRMLPDFTKKEALIANYLLERDPIVVVHLTADELAKKARSSKSAFIRMCQKLGYEGYTEFKFAFSRELIRNTDQTTDENASETKDPIMAISSAYSRHIMSLPTMVSQDEVKKLSHLILHARRVKVLGYNRTGLSAMQLRMRLSKIGVDCEAITDPVVMRDVLATLHQDDLCIIFSIKGMSTIYADYVLYLKESKCPLTVITMTPKTSLAQQADQLFLLPYISRTNRETFLDDQAIFFVFIELLLNELANEIQ